MREIGQAKPSCSDLSLTVNTNPDRKYWNQALLREHCYYSLDYSEDIQRASDLQNLVDFDRIIQFPFKPLEDNQKPDEVLLRMQERKREQGRRLQAQAQAQRLEKVGRSRIVLTLARPRTSRSIPALWQDR